MTVLKIPLQSCVSSKKILEYFVRQSLLPAIFPTFAFSATGTEQPNIVYITCDDLGYRDIHYFSPETSKIATLGADMVNRRHRQRKNRQLGMQPGRDAMTSLRESGKQAA